ncbi:PDR/VanB family oxidoreductase [Hydrogenophaga sp. BPS33]|uniref:PDR/VanB family oxidoreductase n=1 Tax=Hydrogenophaga sp. BPS33 TaxID=2651974 RepID=UPI00131F4F35|nr:PDR/VanB family oxidoreductase [Hydrogenophaga sp. BPS33]QHE85550.1 oxidoreductase [Hydrogenophaga sp. BPS33]
MGAHAVLQAVVVAKRTETPDICAFELEGVGAAALPPFAPGAHIDVHLPNGLVRQYSLCNAPSPRGRYLLGVRRAPDSRGGSRALHETVGVGDTLRIGAPRNLFALHPQARYSVLVGAGIGITPLLSMAEHLSAQGAAFELHYVVRSREAAGFLRCIESSRFADHVRVHVSGGLPAARVSADRLVPPPGPDHHLYVCGPTGFMDAVSGAARRAGWAAQRLHQEHFAAAATIPSEAGGFEVVLARSGRCVAVRPGQVVTQALAAAGVAIPTSCEQGVCGTCLTRVLDGEPDHRDLYLSADEQARNDQFLPCCSRSRSPRLTLDL